MKKKEKPSQLLPKAIALLDRGGGKESPEFSTAVESGCPWKTKGKNLAAVEKKKHVAVETTPSFITLGFFSLKNSQSGFFLWD